MIDLTELFTRVDIAVGIGLIALMIFLKFFAKFPSRKSSRK